MSFGPYYCNINEKEKEELKTLGDNTINVKNTDPEARLVKRDSGLLDVVNDFVWTASPLKNSSDTIPTLYAVELRQSQNSLVSSALYYIAAAFNFFDTNVGGSSPNSTESLSWLLEKCAGAGGGNFFDKLKQKLTGIVAKDKELLGKYLQSYVGIYITEETGFRYAIPFFEGTPHNISSSWQSSAQIKNPITSTLEKSMDWVDRAASTLNIMTPGTYIEKPKYFQYPGEGESFTIKLPLLNTLKKGDKVPYQQNYELLWMLAYQNKPYRTSFSRILPPKLYTVSVPGIKNMPYAYISKMDVNFLGTRRQLPVNIPTGQIITSIPEAYEITITFTSMLADTGNLMINNGFRDKVSVRVR